MKFRALMLADYAVVRDGLLFVVGGGVKVVFPSTLPAPLPISVAGLVEVEESEFNEDGGANLNIRVRISRKGKRPIVVARGLVAARPRPDMSPHVLGIPFAIDLRLVSVSTETEHFIHVQAGTLTAKVPFEVVIQVQELPPGWLEEQPPGPKVEVPSV